MQSPQQQMQQQMPNQMNGNNNTNNTNSMMWPNAAMSNVGVGAMGGMQPQVDLSGLDPQQHGVLSYESCYLAQALDTLPERLRASTFTDDHDVIRDRAVP